MRNFLRIFHVNYIGKKLKDKSLEVITECKASEFKHGVVPAKLAAALNDKRVFTENKSSELKPVKYSPEEVASLPFKGSKLTIKYTPELYPVFDIVKDKIDKNIF